MPRPRHSAALVSTLAFACLAAPASAQFNPNNGQWLKEDPTHLRVMTWNMLDAICSSAPKSQARPDWNAIVHIIADLQPDIILFQETGGNGENGTGSGTDTTTNLETTVGLLVYGGPDPFRGGSVSSYVRLYAPNYELPYVFASPDTDGNNRNVIASRYPFADLNGDGVITMTDFTVISSQYATGGDGGVRGFMTAEIDLPDEIYAGDVVIGNSHLKAFGDATSMARRITAAQNIAYFIDYYFNGAGTGNVDPLNAVFTPVNGVSTTILDENTPVIWGGDWNEDEFTNGRKGPAEWMTRAALTGGTDGTDRDRTDAMHDDSRDFFLPTSRTTQNSGSKLDYIAWQDSIATFERSFVFNTSSIAFFSKPFPPALASMTSPSSASSDASDHRPVVADFSLPLAAVGCACDTDGSTVVDLNDYFDFLGQFFTQLNGPGSADFDGSGTVDINDYFAFLGCFFSALPTGSC